MGNNACCCSNRNTENEQKSLVDRSQDILMINRFKEKISLLKNKLSIQTFFPANYYKDSSDPQQNILKGLEDSISYQLYSYKMRPYNSNTNIINNYQNKNRIESISSLTSKQNSIALHLDDCETIYPGRFYFSGKLLLYTADIHFSEITFEKQQSSILQNQFKKIFIHSQINDRFQSFQEKQMSYKISKNQTLIIEGIERQLNVIQSPSSIILRKSNSPSPVHFNKNVLQTETTILAEDQIIQFLRKSVNYKNIIEITKYYETGNSIVYKVLYQPEYQNIIIKIPKEFKHIQNNNIEDLAYETQLQKIIYNQDYINEIKEEIVVINSIDQSIYAYIVIQEESQFSLYDLIHYQIDESSLSQGIWHNEEMQKQNSQFYSFPKFLYYTYKAIETLSYIHQQGIILGYITPKDIMIDNHSQKIKFRNFSFSIITNQGFNHNQNNIINLQSKRLEQKLIDMEEDEYRIKYYSEIYSCQLIQDQYMKFLSSKKESVFGFYSDKKEAIIQKFLSEYLWAESILYENDRYSLAMSFSTQPKQIIQNQKISYNGISKILLKRQNQNINLQTFFENKVIKYLLNASRQYQLNYLMQIIENYFIQNIRLVTFLVDSMIYENKFDCGIEICSKIINGLKSSYNENGLKIQQNLISLYIKRSKLYKQLDQNKKVIKDIKKALLIYNMHFKNKLKEQCELMLFMVEILLDQQETSDTLIKLNSINQIIKDNENLQDNFQLINKMNQLYCRLHLLRDNQEKFFKFNDQSQNQIVDYFDDNLYNYYINDNCKKMYEQYKQLGDFNQCKYELKNFENQIIQLYGQNSMAHGQYYFFLGEIDYEQGTFDTAISHFLKYLQIHKQYFSESNEDRAKIYNILGEIYQKKCFFQKSLKFYSKALEICLQKQGETNLKTSDCFRNLGNLYKIQGQFDRSAQYFQKELQIKQEIYGQDHINLSSTFNNLGLVYKSLKLYDSSIQCFEQSIRLKKKINNKVNNQDIAQSMHYLGQVFRDKSDYQKAISYLKESLKIKRQLYQQSHPSIGQSYGCLAGIYQLLDQPQKALEYTKAEMDIITKCNGPQDIGVAYCLQRMGLIFMGIGNFQRAQEHLQQCKGFLIQLQNSKQAKELLIKIEKLIAECGGTNSQAGFYVKKSQYSTCSSTAIKKEVYEQ